LISGLVLAAEREWPIRDETEDADEPVRVDWRRRVVTGQGIASPTLIQAFDLTLLHVERDHPGQPGTWSNMLSELP